jgi:hypothetical protein
MQLAERESMLLEKALSGALLAEERKEFKRLLQSRPDIRAEWESVSSLQEVTSAMRLKKAPEETWDQYWAGVYSRMERGIAWLLISVGAVVLLALAAYEAVLSFVETPDIPLAVKLATGALVAGLAVLIVSIAREKWSMRKSDKYKEVVR